MLLRVILLKVVNINKRCLWFYRRHKTLFKFPFLQNNRIKSETVFSMSNFSQPWMQICKFWDLFASGLNIHHCQPFHPFSLAPDITLKWHQNIVLRNIDGMDFENPFYDGSVGSRLSLQNCIRPICPIMVEDLLRIVTVMHPGRQLVQKQKVSSVSYRFKRCHVSEEQKH